METDVLTTIIIAVQSVINLAAIGAWRQSIAEQKRLFNEALYLSQDKAKSAIRHDLVGMAKKALKDGDSDKYKLYKELINDFDETNNSN